MACFKTTFVLFGLSLHTFYSVLRNRACAFLGFEMELSVAVVNDVKSLTIVIDSSLLWVRQLPLIIIVAIFYFYYLLWRVIRYIISNMKTIVETMLTIDY